MGGGRAETKAARSRARPRKVSVWIPIHTAIDLLSGKEEVFVHNEPGLKVTIRVPPDKDPYDVMETLRSIPELKKFVAGYYAEKIRGD